MNEDNSETRAALEQAIQDHFRAVTKGGLSTNWVIQIAGVREDTLEGNHALWLAPVSQPFYTTLGLVEYLGAQLKRALANDIEWDEENYGDDEPE